MFFSRNKNLCNNCGNTEKDYEKMLLLAKTKLNIINSMALIDWNISHDELVSVSNGLKNMII